MISAPVSVSTLFIRRIGKAQRHPSHHEVGQAWRQPSQDDNAPGGPALLPPGSHSDGSKCGGKGRCRAEEAVGQMPHIRGDLSAKTTSPIRLVPVCQIGLAHKSTCMELSSKVPRLAADRQPLSAFNDIWTLSSLTPSIEERSSHQLCNGLHPPRSPKVSPLGATRKKSQSRQRV